MSQACQTTCDGNPVISHCEQSVDQRVDSVKASGDQVSHVFDGCEVLVAHSSELEDDQHTVFQQCSSKQLSSSSDSHTVLITQDDAKQHEPSGAGGGSREDGRATATQVEQDGVASPSDGAVRGERHLLRHETEDRAPAGSYPPQSGQPQEARTPEMVSRPASDSSDWSRDHLATAEVGHDQALPDHTARRQRPSGVRESLKPHILRDPFGCSVLPMGDDHSTGGSVLSSAVTAGEVDRDAEARAQQHQQRGDHEEGLHRTTAQDHAQGKGRQELGQSGQCKFQCHNGSIGQHHGDHEGTQGGGERAQVRAPAEKGEGLRRQFCEGRQVSDLEWSETLVSQESSDLEGCRRTLSESAARHLELQSQRVAPEIFQGLVQEKRTILLEVACSPNSRLSAAVQELAGYPEAAVRCSHWNNFDLGTHDGVKLLLQKIDQLNPMHVWISTDCGPYSPIQNLNMRTEDQRAQLDEKRKEVLRQYVGASCVLHYAIQKGCHVSWE